MATRGTIGLALAGGGPEGAVYEMGALRALDEALDLDLTGLSVYVGVSAGSFVAACLANGIAPAQLCRGLVSSEPGEHPFEPQTFFRPAVREFIRRGRDVPGNILGALAEYWRRPSDLGLLESLLTLSRTLPTGLFDGEPLRRYVEGLFSIKGRTDDFRDLSCRLYVVATDLCSTETVRFGEAGHDHVPISRAVQASSALPGMYPPVKIDGRYYVDGVLRKTVHGSVALDDGVGLLLCINPLVPVAVESGCDPEDLAGRTLLGRGMPAVLSQTLRTIIHSRMQLGMRQYAARYPDADVILLEPRRADLEMFYTNIFSFSARKAVAEHAYRTTRHSLLTRQRELAPVLARHGIRLRVDLLEEERDLWEQVGVRRPAGRGMAADMSELLDRIESFAGRSAHPPGEPSPEPGVTPDAGRGAVPRGRGGSTPGDAPRR